MLIRVKHICTKDTKGNCSLNQVEYRQNGTTGKLIQHPDSYWSEHGWIAMETPKTANGWRGFHKDCVRPALIFNKYL